MVPSLIVQMTVSDRNSLISLAKDTDDDTDGDSAAFQDFLALSAQGQPCCLGFDITRLAKELPAFRSFLYCSHGLEERIITLSLLFCSGVSSFGLAHPPGTSN